MAPLIRCAVRALVIAALCGIAAPAGAQTPPPAASLTLETLFNLGRADLDDFWQKTLAAGRSTYRAPAQLYYYTSRVITPCDTARMGNAFYCGADHSVYYDLHLLRYLFARYGDFGALAVLAHEWGHAVQSQLGHLAVVPAIRKWQELQADCFAGSYAQFLENKQSQRLVLDPGDLEEGANTLFSMGDSLPWFDRDAHGSPDERSLYFVVGLAEGVEACYTNLTYRDAASAFAIAYPRTWRTQHSDVWTPDRKMFVKRFMMSPPRAERAELNGYLSEGVRIKMELPPRGSQWTAAYRTQWSAGLLRSWLQANPKFQVVDSQLVTLNGLAGRRYRVHGSDARVREPERTSLVVLTGPAYVMYAELASPASVYGYYQDRLDQLLATFRVLTPQAPAR